MGRGVDKISESLGDPGSELSGSEKAAVAIKPGRRTLGWRLNNRAETRSNRTLKLHLPGRRPGPGSGEDSLAKDPSQPPTVSGSTSALQLRWRKLFAQPCLPKPQENVPSPNQPSASTGRT